MTHPTPTEPGFYWAIYIPPPSQAALYKIKYELEVVTVAWDDFNEKLVVYPPAYDVPDKLSRYTFHSARLKEPQIG